MKMSVKTSSIVSQLNYWAWDESVERVVDRLRPLFLKAKTTGTFINLDMEEYHDLELTIDANIQDVADKALAKGVQAHGGHTGMALVMEVETGELLAVSNYPFFDPNAPGKTEMFIWKNRAFKDQFEPGSTLKVFSLAAVLEQGETSLDESLMSKTGD